MTSIVDCLNLTNVPVNQLLALRRKIDETIETQLAALVQDEEEEDLSPLAPDRMRGRIIRFGDNMIRQLSPRRTRLDTPLPDVPDADPLAADYDIDTTGSRFPAGMEEQIKGYLDAELEAYMREKSPSSQLDDDLDAFLRQQAVVKQRTPVRRSARQILDSLHPDRMIDVSMMREDGSGIRLVKRSDYLRQPSDKHYIPCLPVISSSFTNYERFVGQLGPDYRDYADEFRRLFASSVPRPNRRRPVFIE